jgi:hypothetical protein
MFFGLPEFKISVADYLSAALKFFAPVLILFAAPSLKAQILTEIMFNPSEENGEFIELLNNTDSTIVLNKWGIKYHSSSPDLLAENDSGNILFPGQYGVIFDGDYDFNSGSYFTVIPFNAKVMFIDNSAFGRSGMSNSSNRRVYLIDENNDTVDVYMYSADNGKGISDERVYENDSLWKNSIIPGGTPGKPNSVSPRK